MGAHLCRSESERHLATRKRPMRSLVAPHTSSVFIHPGIVHFPCYFPSAYTLRVYFPVIFPLPRVSSRSLERYPSVNNPAKKCGRPKIPPLCLLGAIPGSSQDNGLCVRLRWNNQRQPTNTFVSSQQL